MARISRSDPGERASIDAKVGVKMARAIRKHIGKQVSEVLCETELTGSPHYIAIRARDLAAAERGGDDMLRRAAAMELAAAAAAYAAHIEMTSPEFARMRTNLARK